MDDYMKKASTVLLNAEDTESEADSIDYCAS
jgi:hypothetical protein